MAEDREINKAWFVVENGEISGIKFEVWDDGFEGYVSHFFRFPPCMKVEVPPDRKEEVAEFEKRMERVRW